MRTIELAHGQLRRGRRLVLAAAALELPPAGTVGVVGINGAGKSTLFHALAGDLHDGTAGLRGVGASRPGPVGFAPQQPAFPEWLDVPDVARLYGCELDEVCRQNPGLLIEELAQLPAHALSAGQRQALSIGLALAGNHRLTLLDEPFAPLDFRRRYALVRLLRARRGLASGQLILVSSQSAADLLDTCDWILVMRDGRYVHSGAADALAAGIADPARARQRFEEGIMALLGAASPARVRVGSLPWRG